MYFIIQVRGKGLLNAIVISPEFSATEVSWQFLDAVASLAPTLTKNKWL